MSDAPGFRVHAAIALLSAALIALQLALMQLFALVQWHHYAWLVISIALLGFGASGSIFTLLRVRMLAARIILFPVLATLCAVLIPLCTSAALDASTGFDPFLLFTEPARAWQLLLTCLLLFLPFVPGAVILIMAFASWPERMGALYLSNLAGSGGGGLLALILPWLLAPAAVPSAVALLAVAAALLLLPQRSRALILLPFLALPFCLWFAAHPAEPELSQFKDLRRALDLPEARITMQANSPFGMLHVVSAPALRHAPGVSLTYEGEIPVRDAVFRDGMMVGAVVGLDTGKAARMLDFGTQALPYVFRAPARVLILETGTGEDVVQALGRGANAVTALQPDGGLARLLRDALAGVNDSLFFHPRVRVLQRSARSALAADAGRYDLIVHPVVESMGGSAGQRALQEEYTLTVEAFEAMWQRLSADGCIAVTVWMDYPWRSTLRLAATIGLVLQRAGVDARRHLAAVRSWGTLTFVLSRPPIIPAEARRVRDFCERLQFDPMLLPDLAPNERERFHRIGEPGFFTAVDRLLGPRRGAFIESYPFRIAPATDDRPFFSQFLTASSIAVIARDGGRAGIPAMELGTIIVPVGVGAILLLSLLFIVLPLPFRATRSKGRGWTFLHFSAIGIGFMFVEILLLHHFVLYFGNPVHAAAAVISILLLSAGTGSLFSGRLTHSHAALFRICAVVALCLCAGVLLLQPVLAATVQTSMGIKAIIAVLIIFPTGFLMGMPFPLGIGLLGKHAPALIPWAWAVNGCFSVVSTGAATLLALQSGFSVVLLAAAGMYGIAAAVSFLRPGAR